MKTVDQMIDELISIEGGYSDNPDDKGGKTKFGITEKTARAAGYVGDMRDLTIAMARTIYLNEYITKPGFDTIRAASELVGAELFDTGVNMGPPRATMFLQRALNVLYDVKPPLDVDGKMGPATRAAFTAYLKSRLNADVTLTKLLNCFQGVRYAELVEADASQRTFVNGWINNRVVI